ncbi:MAG: RagB/SusD family nutrient uptake outer membrane protein [Muribaculaceae bacterium]|nr:RagB/SusD family nutrient uptake outer membrane protein [Muribaculaceae bacterium]
MKLYKYMALGAVIASASLGTSCVGDLDITPDDPNKQTSPENKDQWIGYFGTLYGNLLYEGNLTPTGVDGGAGTFSRCHWNLQELTTDEVVLLNTWNDPGYADIKFNTWTSNNVWSYMCMQREATSARQCMEFVANIDAASSLFSAEEIEQMKAEAYVLHALNYYYMIDLFGRGPWCAYGEKVGETPATYDRQQMFDATVAELKAAIDGGHLLPASQQVYGRVSREAARMLLAKLYLNAEVYTGTPMYTECAAQCKEILKTIPDLVPEYKYLFCGTNDKYVGNGEILWSIPSDPVTQQSYGGTTYLTAGAYFGSVEPEELQRLGNPNSIWNGLKMKPELVEAFEPGDKRALYYAGSFNLSVADLNSTEADGDGYMCVKYVVTDEDDYYNTANNSQSIVFPKTDFPLFRLADLYLMLTECQLRGVADADPGYNYFNKVRARAGLAATTPNLDGLLHERLVELYWEGHRRSDLVRFGKFTGNAYVWSWKGGVPAGTTISSNRDVFAVPYQYVSTVGQNPGY